MLAAIALVTLLSLVPARAFAMVPRFILHADKVGHFLSYGLLVLLGRWAILPDWAFRLTFAPLVLGAIAYGALMELVQGAMVGQSRTCELGDFIANSLGAISFWASSGWLFPSVPAPVVVHDPFQDRTTQTRNGPASDP